MKKIFMAALAVAALPAGVFAQAPALTHVASVNVGAISTTPMGLAVASNKVFGVGFGNQTVFQITDADTATPTAGSIGTLAPAWGASRGPQDIIVDGSTLLIIGDDGTTGRSYTVSDLGNATPTVSAETLAAPVSRVVGGTLFGSDLILGRSNNSQIQVIPKTLAGAGVLAPNGNLASPLGFGSPVRDIVVVNDVIYFVNNTSGATNIAKFTPTTAGDVTAGVFERATSLLASGGNANYVGLTTWTNDTTTYVVAPWNDSVGGRGVAFFDTANFSAAPTVIVPTELAGAQLTGIAIGDINGAPHLAISSVAGTTPPNQVHIFELPAAVSSVAEWNLLD